MVDVVIPAIIGDMISRAISLAIGRSAGRLGTQSKLGGVRYMLIKIESMVEEAKGRQIINHGTLQWLSELIDCVHQGRYLLDASRNGSIDLTDDTNSKVLAHPHRFLFSSSNPAKRLRVAGSIIKRLFSNEDSLDEINSVVAKLQSVSNDLREFIMLLENCPPIRKPVSTNLYADCEMFGRHVEKERAIGFLLHKNSNPSARNRDVLPIIGHVGVGKTTLVQHVCDDERVRSRFSPIMLFDSFSFRGGVDNTETRVVLHSEHITGGMGNLNESLQVLKHRLRDKRFLLVFENVDPHKEEMLHVLLSSLGCGEQGSKIIVTGSSNHVARIGTSRPIKLRKLPHAEYWFYFKALAFPGADLPRLMAVGQAIAKRLSGSFFGAKIIGALLRAHPNHQFWCKALRSSSIWELPVLGSSLPYISDMASYFLSGNLTMCHVNACTSRPGSRDGTLCSLQDFCLASPQVHKDDLVDGRGNSLNLHVLLCKSVLPVQCVYYVAHCHLGVNNGCGLII